MIELIEQTLSEHGGAAAFSLLLLLKIGEMIYNYVKEKAKVTDSTLQDHKVALDRNTQQVIALQIEMKKMRTDLKHAFFALKELSGKAWPTIAEKIEEFNRKERGL